MPVNSFDSYPLTWKPRKEALSQPYYRALARDLEEKIKAGLLAPGVRLPPQREIADYLDLNYTTITRAYELCKRKGLIYGAAGKGTFVAPHAAEDVTLASGRPSKECIELGAINGFSEYSELVEQATRSVVEKGYLRSLYEYSFPAGQPHQLAAGARWLEQLGVHTAPEHMAILSGAQNALAVALISLFSPGDRIAVDEYTYPNFMHLARLLHLVLVPIREDKDGMLPEELRKQCHRLRGVYLIPTCANPTTITMPPRRRAELAEIIRENDLILIEDDIATWMTAWKSPAPPSMFDLLNGGSIYVCGMTKSLCPGLRVAFMAFGERWKETLLHGLANLNIKTSAFDAEIITELILSGKAYELASKKQKSALKNASLFQKYFADMPSAPLPSYYKWMPIRIEKTAEEIEGELEDRGVRVCHSRRFSVLQDSERNFLRISLCSAGSGKRLEQGLVILRDYLREHEKG